MNSAVADLAKRFSKSLVLVVIDHRFDSTIGIASNDMFTRASSECYSLMLLLLMILLHLPMSILLFNSEIKLV